MKKKLYIMLCLLCICILSSTDSTSAKISNLKTMSSATLSKPIFIGCPSDEGESLKVLELMKKMNQSWNQHKVNEVMNYYSSSFKTKDGLNIDKIKNNLQYLFGNYDQVQLNSYPLTIYVCGNQAYIQAEEETHAIQIAPSNNNSTNTNKNKKAKKESISNNANNLHLVALVTGITYLQKINNEWKITQEQINTETTWKFVGNRALEAIEKGFVKLITPNIIESGQNYIATLSYKLPPNLKAIAFIDQMFLGEFSQETDMESKFSLEKLKAEKNRLFDIARPITDSDNKGLRRLFTANTDGQGELISAHIELVELIPDDKLKLAGIITISQRVEPYLSARATQEQSIVSQSFRDEYQQSLNKSTKSTLEPESKSKK